MSNNDTSLTSLLKEKNELKKQIKRAKQKVTAQHKQIDKQKQRAEKGQTNTLAFEQKELPKHLSSLIKLKSQLDELKISIEVTKSDLNNLSLRQSEITEQFLTPFERIMRELNIVAWAFECQFMEASTNLAITPLLHSKGRYLAGIYHIKSNVEIIKLQDYIRHYTERFETSTNTVILINELLQIHEKANNILSYYNENLIDDAKIVNEFHNNTPNDFKEKTAYFDNHTGFIIADNLNPQHIVFGKENWNEYFEFNYITTNQELALFCQKLINFIDKFNLKDKEPQQSKSNTQKTLNIKSIKKEQNNLIPKVSIDEVFNHFEILTKTTNRSDEFYLTNEQLLTFINATFVECKPIEQDFNCNGFVKKNIRSVFYDFYFKNKNKEPNQTKIKRKYFNIMDNAFYGFNENDYTDFSK